MTKNRCTALITGFDGFVGPYLALHLLDHGRRVWGTMYKGLKEIPPHPLKETLRKNAVRILPVDLVDDENVGEVIDQVKPDEVYHLAGISHIPTSWENPRLTFLTNVMGTVNLLEAIRNSGRRVRVLIISSAEVYGKPAPGDLPTRETAPIKPGNPYAASKAALDLLAFQWSRYPGMHVVRARPFSHTGPGQSPNFVCSGFARQLAAVSLGQAPPLVTVGNLSVRRDFTDVRDVARAYRLVLEKGKNGEVYNICSGKSYSIKTILQTLVSFSDQPIKVKKDPARLRVSDVPETRGSCAKLKKATGWQPEIPFPQTLRDLYEYWKHPVSRKAPE